MILGSICANKTEGIGYPQFIRVTNVPGSPAVTRTETTPEISQMEPPTNSMSQGGYTGESIATVTEIGLGIGIAKKPTPEKKLEEPPTATVVPVTPKPTPAPVAPAPAPGSNAADSIVGSTVADKPATGIITNAPSTQTPPIAAPISNSASPVHVVVGK